MCRVTSAADFVKKGQEVWVKVVSMAGGQLRLSMRDVDQATGRDLLAGVQAETRAVATGANAAPVPSALHGLSGIRLKGDVAAEPARRKKRLTSPERWEITQLIKTGVLDPSEYPNYDAETGTLNPEEEEVVVRPNALLCSSVTAFSASLHILDLFHELVCKDQQLMMWWGLPAGGV